MLHSHCQRAHEQMNNMTVTVVFITVGLAYVERLIIQLSKGIANNLDKLQISLLNRSLLTK